MAQVADENYINKPPLAGVLSVKEVVTLFYSSLLYKNGYLLLGYTVLDNTEWPRSLDPFYIIVNYYN